MRFPSFVVLYVSSQLEVFTPKVLRKTRSTSKGVTIYSNVYVSGQWTTRVDIHYLSKGAGRDDQTLVVQKMIDLFQDDFVLDKTPSATLTLSFGDQPYETFNVQFLQWYLDQKATDIQKGERRSIFELTLDIPRLIETPTPQVQEIKIKTAIGEKVKPSLREILEDDQMCAEYKQVGGGLSDLEIQELLTILGKKYSDLTKEEKSRGTALICKAGKEIRILKPDDCSNY